MRATFVASSPKSLGPAALIGSECGCWPHRSRLMRPGRALAHSQLKWSLEKCSHLRPRFFRPVLLCLSYRGIARSAGIEPALIGRRSSAPVLQATSVLERMTRIELAHASLATMRATIAHPHSWYVVMDLNHHSSVIGRLSCLWTNDALIGRSGTDRTCGRRVPGSDLYH
jgi:hypothetical protein